MKITKMVPCIKNRVESALTLNNGGDLTGHFLDVLVLGDGAVEVLWSVQRQPVNVCNREREKKIMYIAVSVISITGNLSHCLFPLHSDVQSFFVLLVLTLSYLITHPLQN